MIEALGIAMVKNDVDVIEAFVRHNLGFMDALAIVDNDSIDGTREILVQLQQEGLPIILFDDPVVGYFMAEIVTAVYRKVVPKFKPRFVFCQMPMSLSWHHRERRCMPSCAHCVRVRSRNIAGAPTSPRPPARTAMRQIHYEVSLTGRWLSTSLGGSRSSSPSRRSI